MKKYKTGCMFKTKRMIFIGNWIIEKGTRAIYHSYGKGIDGIERVWINVEDKGTFDNNHIIYLSKTRFEDEFELIEDKEAE